ANFNALTVPPRVTSSSKHATPPLQSTSPPTYPAKIIVSIASSSPTRTPPTSPHRTTSSRLSSPTQQQQQHHLQSHPFHPLIASLNSPHPSFDITLTPFDRAAYHLLRARLYAFLPWRDERVYEDLGRCLKLDAANVDAWNRMGEWYCGGMVVGGACGSGRDGGTGTGRGMDWDKQNMDQSEKLCKEALALDIRDGKSWFGLGCLYLKKFFLLTFDLKDLHKALAAYNHAELDPIMHRDPDLYANRASIHQYTQSYPSAVRDFTKAAECDPGSGNEWWDTRDEIVAMVRGMSVLVERCNSGDVEGGGGKWGDVWGMEGREIGEGVQAAVGEEGFLERGERNRGRWMRVRVVQCVGAGLPRTFIAQDVQGRHLGVSLFNIAVAIGVGDELVVADPVVFWVPA
ncbi:hypothetical protein HDU98_004001, partial [Podochytrium sp. JEL0797]